MKVLLDTNVVLDLLLNRKPFADEAIKIFSLIELKKIDAYLCATTLTTIHYLVSKNLSKTQTDEVIQNLLKLFEIAKVDKNILVESLANNGKDFEDSVLYTSAKFCEVDIIITRDKKGFKNSKVSVYEPLDFLLLLKNI